MLYLYCIYNMTKPKNQENIEEVVKEDSNEETNLKIETPEEYMKNVKQKDITDELDDCCLTDGIYVAKQYPIFYNDFEHFDPIKGYKIKTFIQKQKHPKQDDFNVVKDEIINILNEYNVNKTNKITYSAFMQKVYDLFKTLKNKSYTFNVLNGIYDNGEYDEFVSFVKNKIQNLKNK